MKIEHKKFQQSYRQRDRGGVGNAGANFRHGPQRFLHPMALAWISSGMLFSYNLFSAIRTDSQFSPEYPLLRMLTTEAGVILGVMMIMIILFVLHERRRAL